MLATKALQQFSRLHFLFTTFLPEGFDAETSRSLSNRNISDAAVNPIIAPSENIDAADTSGGVYVVVAVNVINDQTVVVVVDTFAV